MENLKNNLKIVKSEIKRLNKIFLKVPNTDPTALNNALNIRDYWIYK